MTQKPSQRIRQFVLAGTSVIALGAASLMTANFASATTTDDSAPDEPLTAPSDCDLYELPYPDEYGMSFGLAMDPTGTKLAGRGYPEDPAAGYERYLMVWEEGEYTEIDVDGEGQSLSGINSHGDASINTHIDDAATPKAYVDGEVVELAHDNPGQARDINEDGVIVGVIERNGLLDTMPVYWENPDAEPVQLELPEGSETGVAASIDGDTIVGSVAHPDQEGIVPAAWDLDGSVTELPVPDDADEYFGGADDIRDGWVTGTLAEDPGSDSVAVRWNAEGDVEILDDGRGAGVNAEGWVAGQTLAGEPVIWADGERIALPVVDDGEFANNQALDISDDGSTVVGTVDTDSEQGSSLAAAKWTCE